MDACGGMVYLQLRARMLQGYRLGISFPRRWERTGVDLVNMVCMVVPWYWRSEGLVNGLSEQGGRGQEGSKGKDEGGEGRGGEKRRIEDGIKYSYLLSTHLSIDIQPCLDSVGWCIMRHRTKQSVR